VLDEVGELGARVRVSAVARARPGTVRARPRGLALGEVFAEPRAAVDVALIARRLREASPTAYPNRLMVRLADEALSRRGRMIDAIERIGRGELASEAIPFSLAADVTADASR